MSQQGAQQGENFRAALAELGLSAEQQGQVHAIFGKVQSGEIKPGGGAIMQEVGKVLTPEQLATLRQKLGR